MPVSNVALVGFMGAGKSTVGRALAARLKKSFVETDAMVERNAGMSVPEVFGQYGEPRFRELEADVVRELVDARNCVIACGGGVVLREENAVSLKSMAVLVYLEVSASSVLQRLTPQSAIRPLLQTPDREAVVRQLLAQRRPLYESVADITVSTDGLLTEQVVWRIERLLARL